MELSYDKNKYLKLLSKEYQNVYEVCEEIINLQAILNLPKGTEMFLSDIHGEYEPFVHILNNGGGIIKNKIEEIYGKTLPKADRDSLATLIYYPEEKLSIIKKETLDLNEWYLITLYRLIEITKKVSSKYTRSKVRKAITTGFKYVIDELLNSPKESEDKEKYYNAIIKTIINLNQADAFIIAISDLIKRLAIDHLHVVGDIFDRGPHPELVMKKLKAFHSIDFQWGNHDILWMGATSGNQASIATVVRICARYNNLSILELGYGINTRPLSTFAMETYKDDACEGFYPKIIDETKYDDTDKINIAKIHKAITIIQFKLEGQMIKRHPEYHLDNRLLLDKMNLKKGYVRIDGKDYELTTTSFPTIDEKDPYKLTLEEQEVVERLVESFKNSPALNEDIDFLYNKGELYTIFNNNLLFHACIPMDKDGNFKELEFLGKIVSGKEYLDLVNNAINKVWSNKKKISQECLDIMWYLWISPDSPFFGKDKMATFESYFVKDKAMSKETKNPYFYLTQEESICIKILNEFGLNSDTSHIVNGHMPVKAKDGEDPIRGNGKMLVIDGGFAKSYQKATGNAGYILTYNSNGLILSQNKPFESIDVAIKEEKDIITEIVVKENVEKKTVGDTDTGLKLKEEIAALTELLLAYESGEIKQKV